MVPIGCRAVPETLEVRPARHAAVLVQDLHDDGGRFQSGEPRQVAAGFGMSGPCEHPTRLRHDREDMAGLAQILGPGIRRDCGVDRAGAIVRRNTRRDAFGSFDRHGEIGRVMLVGIVHHERQAQLPQRSRVSVRQIRPRP